MPYPQEIDRFTDKLNKKIDGTRYVIEEEVAPVDGVYEGELQHDNVVKDTIRVYTGPKMTGIRIDQFVLSVPSERPWRMSIKIFSSVPKLYISYETPGDTVEADDVNALQESIVNTQTEIERYKASNDARVSENENRLTAVENNKADKTYVDIELFKKADKSNTYTKAETDAKIQSVIGAAPTVLDTLQEIAQALNNDSNFAVTITNELAKKVDKIDGKQLSTEDYTTDEKNKLAGIEAGANKYIHPSTHPASMITQDANNRFVTDAEKAAWNNKLDSTANAVSASKLAVARTISLTGDVSGSVSFDGSSNVSMTTIVADDSHNHVIANIDDLQAILDTKANVSQIPTKTSQLTNDSGFVTQSELGAAGYGDMMKSTYDTDNDGIVNNADKLDGKHASDLVLKAGDTMTGALTVPNLIAKVIIPSSSGPSAWPAGFVAGTVYNNGYPVAYGTIFSYKGTTGNSCVQILQAWPGNDGGEAYLYIRSARDTGTDVFGPWRKVWSENNDGSGSGLESDTVDGKHSTDFMPKGPVTWNQLKGV